MRHFLRFLGSGLLLVGLLCLGYFFYAFFEQDSYQERENADFDRNEIPVAPAAPDIPAKIPHPISPGAVTGAVTGPITGPATGAVIGRLSVPRLGIRDIIDEGVDNRTLARAVGHIPGTAFPGQPGNIALAGHRDTFFRALRQLHRDDEIDLEAGSRKFRYRVDSITVVEPSQTGVLAPTSTNVLTLVTCFPFHYIGNAPRRYIVRASRID